MFDFVSHFTKRNVFYADVTGSPRELGEKWNGKHSNIAECVRQEGLAVLLAGVA